MTAPAPAPTRVRIFRWKGIVPLLLFVVLVVMLYLLFMNLLVARGVEHAGTAVVGARVNVASADVRLRDGVVALRGLQVTNPRQPMTNLFEADQIVLNLRMTPLLEKKLVIDTVAVRGLKFGTPRKTSGAVEQKTEAPAGEVARSIDQWVAGLPIPSFSLEGLSQVVNVDAIAPDSLATLRQARALAGLADSARTTWLARVQQLDPRPQIDSATALAKRLEGQSIRSLGLTGARDAANSARQTITALGQLDNRLKSLQAGVDSSVATARQELAALADAQRQDYAYARRLLKLPSLDAPSLGPALFGRFAAQQAAPILYWLGLAERYMPPGLDKRVRQGPDRVRASGTTVRFPKLEQLPTFLLQVAEASLEIGGTGAAAGNYAATLTDLTSAPALVGRPTVLSAGRTGGRVGPETARIAAILNHVGATPHDSVNAFVSGLTLPTVNLSPVGATLDLGKGTTELILGRQGDNLAARFTWQSSNVAWRKLGADTTSAADTTRRSAVPQQLSAQAVGQSLRGTAEDIAWRAVAGLENVRIDAQLSGSLAHPRLAVGSNVASAVSDGLRAELGAQLQRAEADVRGRVDALVQERVDQAQQAVSAFETQGRERIAAERARLDQAKRDLEARIRALTGIPGIGG
jgi:uncharacterized protein (TIGR03545 family)